MITISALTIYPIKGCGGIAVSERAVVPGGLEYDRRYMLTDESGRMITRREDKRLAYVVVAEQERHFCVSAEGKRSFDLPKTNQIHPEQFSGSIQSSVWSDTPRALLHREGSSWFSELLERPVQLVYMPDASLRQVNPRRADAGDKVSFADGYPILLTSETSLDDLNRRMEQPVSMNRFRPNVVVQGAPSFDEDLWASIALGPVACVLPKLCDRCVVTTIEEGSARRGTEPLKTLAMFQRWNGAVWFGTNVIPKTLGHVRIGDEVHVTATRAHPREG